VALRDQIACAIYSQDFDCEEFFSWEEWDKYDSPWKEQYYLMADKVMALFVAHYGDVLPVGDDPQNECPMGKGECCGWHGACRVATILERAKVKV